MRLPTDFAHLTLLIVRLQDAEILLDAEADALLTQVQAAQAAREQGETDTHRRHLESIAGFVEALVDARLLPGSEGCTVIKTARLMAEEETEDLGRFASSAPAPLDLCSGKVQRPIRSPSSQ